MISPDDIDKSSFQSNELSVDLCSPLTTSSLISSTLDLHGVQGNLRSESTENIFCYKWTEKNEMTIYGKWCQ
jgi:hypothetical protein